MRHLASEPVHTRTFSSVGETVWEFTVDTKGDADLSNDELVSDEGPTVVRGPHPELFMDDAERCALLAEAFDG